MRAWLVGAGVLTVGLAVSHNLRQRLCLFAVAIVGGGWVTLLLLAQFMLPWFREMFSGMSLLLPTRIFVTVSDWLNPAVMALGFASSLVLPQRLYRALVSSYKVPALGPVWRRTDHLWLQHRQVQDHQDETRGSGLITENVTQGKTDLLSEGMYLYI